MNPVRTRSRFPAVVLAMIVLASGGWYAASRMGVFGRGVAALREHEAVFMGRPVFVSSSANGCPEAMLVSDPQKRTFIWPQRDLPAGEIQPDLEYTFTFLEPAFFSKDRLTLARVSLGGETLYDASICRVHRETMHRTVVPTSASAAPMENTLFPHCGNADPCADSNKATIWVCDSCRRERDRWLDKCRQSGTAAR